MSAQPSHFRALMRTSVHAVRVAGMQCPVSRSRRTAVAILGLSLQQEEQQGAMTSCVCKNSVEKAQRCKHIALYVAVP